MGNQVDSHFREFKQLENVWRVELTFTKIRKTKTILMYTFLNTESIIQCRLTSYIRHNNQTKPFQWHEPNHIMSFCINNTM